jgi:hypothetical protein
LGAAATWDMIRLGHLTSHVLTSRKALACSASTVATAEDSITRFSRSPSLMFWVVVGSVPAKVVKVVAA